MNIWKRLITHALAYRGRLAIAFLAMLAYGAGSLALPVLIKDVLNILSQEPEAAGISATWIGALILAAYFVKGVGSYVSDYEMTWVGQRVVMDIRVKLFRHVLDQSAAFFSSKRIGGLVSRLTSDVAHVQRVVAQTVAELTRELGRRLRDDPLHVRDVAGQARHQLTDRLAGEERGRLLEHMAE